MKKVFFLLSFVFALGMATANAQSCQSSASASAAKSCCASKVAKAAAADPNIEKRTADDGTVSYVRKETDTQGNVRFASVQYDETSNAFVNVAPKALSAGDKAGMTKKTAACAAGSGEKAGCCKSKAGSASAKSCAGEKTAATPEQ